MAKQTINNGEQGSIVRGKINDNFTENYTKLDNITVTQAVDLDTIESDTATNNAKVSNATHTGEVTGATALTIAADAVTNAKLANVATTTIKGRVTAGTGDPEDLTATQATTILNTFTSSLKGLVPASSGGTTNFLRADGTFAAPPGGGGLSDGDYTDITVSGSGTVMTIDNDVVTYAKLQNVSATQRVLGRNTSGAGDTEEVTASQILTWLGSTQGQILYHNGSAWTVLGPGTAGQSLITGGAAANPSWSSVILASTSVSTPSLISTAAVTITPAAGSNFNVVLSTTGDFVVNTNQLYVDTSTGFIGLGNSSPISKFHVTTPSASLTNSYFTTNDFNSGTSTGSCLLLDFGATSGNTYTRFSAVSAGGNAWNDLVLQSGGGNVGVGTSSPQAKLHVSGIGTAFRFNNGATDGFAVSQLNTNSWGWNGLSSGMFFNLQNSDFIIVNGNIGIGTAASTTPTNPLTVGGKASIGASYTGTAAPTNGLLVEGSVGIGTSSVNANAILDVQSTTKPFMPPRMTTTQRDAVASPTASMMIYNSTTNKLNVYTTAWEEITSA